MTQSADNTTAVSVDALAQLLTSIFVKAGVNERPARILADNCAGCERDGDHSHGIFRVAGYLNSIASGWVDANAVARLEEAGPPASNGCRETGYIGSAASRSGKGSASRRTNTPSCSVISETLLWPARTRATKQFLSHQGSNETWRDFSVKA